MEEDQRVVDLENPLQRELDKLWGNTNKAENITIFRIPHNISQNRKNLFEPSVISIGPFHRGKKHLQALEKQKVRFLHDFLSRGKHKSLNPCKTEMKSLEERTRRCYSETVEPDSNAFVDMMLLDGCFVLEYFLKLKEKSLNPISEVAWNFNFIVLDLLLLENQIPFFIVERLYEFVLKKKVPTDFVSQIVRYFHNVLAYNSIDFKISDSIDSIIKNDHHPPEFHHLVHLSYHYLVPTIPDKLESSPNSTEELSTVVFPCATQLKYMGVDFKSESEPNHMLDISFERGILKIPKLVIADPTKLIFANLIAFEHSKYGKKHSNDGKKHSPFTMFVAFLDNLVNTPNDVTILQQHKIVDNCLGSEEEVTQFINQVTEFISFEKDHYLAKLYMDVNKYSKSSWHKHRAKLIRDYFGNPWATISLIAAFILLVLTLLQSFFAVYAYFRPPKP